MQPSHEVVLTLRDVETLIARFEERYGVSTAQFLREQDVRNAIPEDDLFRWEAYIDHQRVLREEQKLFHGHYLANLSRTPRNDCDSSSLEKQALLAA